ncbi:SUKH-3 domain-containing protein [Hymenobacter negativus]|uniref:SUKH-3 domain-containing protein n=1 Tax=Hymenobacter negativus TaxID=2795026 RepID=A0ABS3QG39_9BACT|nr:SUKH-3 domain-containing protein [Hymenobacter negativus]MBO2010219.1 SUKH-3 domain-containing protein [Hymenobacter negativus]
MDRFAPAILEYLTKAGWQPGRKVWLAKYRVCLRVEGYPWFPAVAEFLEEFGDLWITYEGRGGASKLTFDACYATGRYDTRWVTGEYASRIGRSQLCAIGELSGHMLLFMDDTGQVYGGYDDILVSFGSGAEAFEALCSNLPVREIP